MGACDVAVVGGGPSGLGLATELAARGVRVVCIDPHPGLVGGRQFTSWLQEWSPSVQPCIRARWAAPSVVTSRHHHVLDRDYALVDKVALHAMLHDRAAESGVVVRTDRARNIAHHDHGSTVWLASGETVEARIVIDATGSGRFLDREPHGALAAQCAQGVVLEVDRHPFQCGEMALMDLRPIDDGETLPTFLFALPLDYHHILIEETSLICTIQVPVSLLRRRLEARMARLGLQGARVVDHTKWHTPMSQALPDRRQRTLGYGAAAAMVNPATGYQVARALSRAPEVARALAEQLDQGTSLDAISQTAWKAIWPRDDVRKWELYGFGARCLYTLDHDRTERFFDAFFSLPSADWGGYFSASLTSTQLAGVMSRVFARLDPALRWDLMRMSTGSSGSANLLRAALAM